MSRKVENYSRLSGVAFKTDNRQLHLQRVHSWCENLDTELQAGTKAPFPAVTITGKTVEKSHAESCKHTGFICYKQGGRVSKDVVEEVLVY